MNHCFRILLLSLFPIINGYCQTNDLFCEQIKALSDVVQNNHYQPKAINDSLSANVFELLIDGLDANKRLFTETDMEQFEVDRYEIDEYISLKTCGFIDKYVSTLQARILETKDIIQSLETAQLDYSGKDSVSFKPQSEFQRFKNNASMRRYWSKRIRFNILKTLIENDSVIDSIKENFKQQEAKVRSNVIQNEICKLDALEHRHGSLDAFVKQTFLNAFLHYQDPNSSFFTATEKDLFENALSNNQFSFGIITAKNDDGDIVVAHITPGSAAFHDGNIEVNDIIKSLKFNSDILETYCVSNDDVIAFTNDKDHHTITFKVLKQNGKVMDIELTKTMTKVEENSITGFIIEGKSRVGYINIPSFYSNFDSPNGTGVSNDIAKELYKLKKENIEGLILDLRFNGGGSMKEAADLSGMFINRGPLSILKFNTNETTTIKDVNRGALFTKPLVVLVNNYSASASEFFAGTMQDYNRAIIVGSSTHGKASAQVILGLGEDERLGFTKLTVEKFYRITGESHQSKGVIPDIVLPNLYAGFQTQEKYEQFSLKNDSISGVRKYAKLKEFPVAILTKNSRERVQKENAFLAVENLNQLILDNYFHVDSQYQLTLENVYNDMKDYRLKWKEMNTPLEHFKASFEVKNSLGTEDLINQNPDQKKINNKLLTDIKSDIYIEEAHAILQDLLTLNPLN